MKMHLIATTEDLRLEKELKENSLHDLEKEIDSVLKFQFSVDANSSAVTMLTEKLESLAEQRKLLKQSLEAISYRLDCSNDSKAARLNLEENLEKFKKGWKKAAPTVQKRFLRRMLDCLVYTKEGIKTFYHLDNLSKSVNQKNEMNIAEGQNPSAFSFLSINQVLRKLVLTSNQLIKSSSAFANGGVGAKTDEHLSLINYPHDIIAFSSNLAKSNFDAFKSLYTKGLSLREISNRFEIPASTIRDELKAKGLPLRSNLKAKTSNSKKPRRLVWGSTPYGYAHLDGMLVIDPKETKVVRIIIALHQKGISFNSIAKTLTAQKIPSKTGRRWNDKTVARIIRRTNYDQNKTED